MEKTVKNYVSEIQKEFPMFSEKEINDIMLAGFRRMHYFIKVGCDVLIRSTTLYGFVIYFGNLTYNSLKHYFYYKAKFKRRLRILWQLYKLDEVWQGYYYLGLTDDNFNKYFPKGYKKTKNPKYLYLEKTILYKIMDELNPETRLKHFFRVKLDIDYGFNYYKPINKIEIPEYIGVRKEDNSIEFFNKDLCQIEAQRIKKQWTLS